MGRVAQAISQPVNVVRLSLGAVIGLRLAYPPRIDKSQLLAVLTEIANTDLEPSSPGIRASTTVACGAFRTQES